uniref:Phosphopantetheine attachment site n=1 Tax=Candidatus Kentrum sp. FW TaxID=2126338 RepID=A0A450TTQ6_9GAMM|nr:MAG: Phosphopantetheine attachment site [Candidatus Kentron sp. FW]
MFRSVIFENLLATQLISRVRTEFGMEIPIRVLFEYPTIKEMADYISASSLNMKPEDALQEDEEEVRDMSNL